MSAWWTSDFRYGWWKSKEMNVSCYLVGYECLRWWMSDNQLIDKWLNGWMDEWWLKWSQAKDERQRANEVVWETINRSVTNGSSREAKPSQIHESWHDTHTFGVSYSVMKLTRLARGSWVLWQLLNRLKKYIFDKSCWFYVPDLVHLDKDVGDVGRQVKEVFAKKGVKQLLSWGSKLPGGLQNEAGETYSRNFKDFIWQSYHSVWWYRYEILDNLYELLSVHCWDTGNFINMKQTLGQIQVVRNQ